MSQTYSNTSYGDHLINPGDVCNNCLQLARVERLDPTREGHEDYERRLARNKQTTTVGYGPADSVSDQKGVFCDCGVESPRERIWTDDEIDDDRFRALIQQMLRTLDTKGVTVDEKQTAGHALRARRNGAAVDAALATGLDHGLAAAATPSVATAD